MVEVLDRGLRELRTRVTAARERIDVRAARADERKLRRDEESVGRYEENDDPEPEYRFSDSDGRVRLYLG